MTKKDGRTADVILASSATSRDLFYATKVRVPDPILFFRVSGRKYLVASDLEIGRMREQATVHHVLPLTKFRKRLVKAGNANPSVTDIAIAVLTEKRIRTARVPHDFPVFTADRFRRAGIRVRPTEAPFWPERTTKSTGEIEAIRAAAILTGEAIEAGIDLIRRSKPVRGLLRRDGKPLTSERVRLEIDRALMERGLRGENTIVAGGEDGVDPHNVGSGPLKSGYPVILDVFPESQASGYHADISRTVFRGRPSKRQREMWDAVLEAQALGCEMTKPGVAGKTIHAAIQKVFRDRGFETGPVNGKMQGFFHGTGHGLGLDVHEPPFFSASAAPLEPGMVITIEPGLYYPGVGGIRIEDDVAVTKDGHDNLVPLEKTFVV
ncbi:MAG: Xaa-Pro peptidase family protein [Planctomycetota bacterium]